MQFRVSSGPLLGSAVARLKHLPGLDIVHLELEVAQEAPQLLQRVLQRGARQQQPVVRVNSRQHVVQQGFFVLQPITT